MSEVLLATKIRIPPVHRKLINRPHLIQRLNDAIAQGPYLILISAPAGYGKSTLLSEWVSQLDIPVAWLSLEKGENIPARFWGYFLAASATIPHLRQAGIGEPILQALQSPQPPPAEVLLPNLVNELSHIEADAVLVLDDLNTITDNRVHQDLVYLVEHLPLSANRLHLVVASRSDPPWPLARWRGRAQLVEIRTADLRFNPEEAAGFLNGVMMLDLSAEDVRALENRTEGWIAGLQMAAVSMQARLKSQGLPGISHFVASFTASNRFILDYLMEEVISLQSAEIQDFLYETSILEQFTAPLCDALTGRQDSQAILDQLEQANLFLIPLDDERSWYRYHHLFGELLRKRLKETRPEDLTELNRRACIWYAENNFLSEAISHALEAGDVMQVNRFVSGNALAMVEHAELLDVLRYFEQIPEEQICSKPWLCVAYAWVKAYVDPSGEIDQILIMAMQSVNGVEDAIERNILTSHLDAVWAYVAWLKGEAEIALDFSHAALENLPEDDWITRAHVLNIEGLAWQYTENLSMAIQSFDAAVLAGQRTGKSYEILSAYTNLAYVNYLQGKLRQAFSLCQQVIHLAHQSGQNFKPNPLLAYAYGTLSIVQLEWNQMEAALRSAQESVALAKGWKQADALHFALTCLSKTLCAAGDLEGAFTANQDAMQLAVQVSPWFYRLSVLNEVWLNVVKGDIRTAECRIREIEPLVKERDKKYTFLIYKTILLYAQGNYQDILTALDKIVEEHEQKGSKWYLLNLLPIQALAWQALGREAEALGVIRYCLALAEPEGYVRIFANRGAPMLELLQAALSQGIETGYINRLLPAFNIPTASPDYRESISHRPPYQIQSFDLVEPLSDRELEVLRLLNTSLDTNEIAAELYVSVNTVRTHIKNIYSKLDVNRRMQAVERAHELKLL